MIYFIGILTIYFEQSRDLEPCLNTTSSVPFAVGFDFVGRACSYKNEGYEDTVRSKFLFCSIVLYHYVSTFRLPLTVSPRRADLRLYTHRKPGRMPISFRSGTSSITMAFCKVFLCCRRQIWISRVRQSLWARAISSGDA